MWIKCALIVLFFLVAIIFFCVERFAAKKYEDLKTIKIEDWKTEDLKLLLSTIRGYVFLILLSLFAACGSLLLGLYLLTRL